MSWVDNWEAAQGTDDSEFQFMRPVFYGGIRPGMGRRFNRGCDYGRWSVPPDSLGSFKDLDDYNPGAGTATSQGVEAVNAPWMKTALGEIGVSERRGVRKANRRILEYFRSSGFWGKDDSGGKNAWCGSFVAWVVRQHNIKPVAKAFRAKQWKLFGKKLDQPVYGAIGIKSRKGGGHVAFIVGQSRDGKKYYMLGGNQDDKVQISIYPRKVWESFVFPSEYDASEMTLPVFQYRASKAGAEQ